MQRFLESPEGASFYKEALAEWDSPAGRRRHGYTNISGRVGWAYDPVSGISRGYGAGSHHFPDRELWQELQWFAQDSVRLSNRSIERLIAGTAKKGLIGFGYPVLELRVADKNKEDIARASRKAQWDGYLVTVAPYEKTFPHLF